MRVSPSFKHLSDAQLTTELARLAQNERHATCTLIACLEEFDRRGLYLGQGFPSIYAYCRQQLHLSDDAAYTRIEVARASRRVPRLLDMLNQGQLSLTTACMLAKVSTREGFELLLPRALARSKREVEVLIAAAYPQPPVPSVIRKLPDVLPAAMTSEQPAQAEAVEGAQRSDVSDRDADLTVLPAAEDNAPVKVTPPSRRPVVAPLSEHHYKLQVTISAGARERLRQIQDLMRHRLPSGDPAAIVEHALEVLHAQLLKQRAADVARPRPLRSGQVVKGRHIPAAVKRAVFRRDQGACAFISESGARCGSTSGVEYHHVRPYATGGEATVENIELRCRDHNRFEWTQHLDRETDAMAGG